jgi:chromosome condensin MukBEF complex kleisin-like MukF subunit
MTCLSRLKINGRTGQFISFEIIGLSKRVLDVGISKLGIGLLDYYVFRREDSTLGQISLRLLIRN